MGSRLCSGRPKLARYRANPTPRFSGLVQPSDAEADLRRHPAPDGRSAVRVRLLKLLPANGTGAVDTSLIASADGGRRQ
jgi:hypothetical protein